MKPNEPLRVQRGSAIFLAPQYDMWTLRQATRRAILSGQAAQDFVVVESTMYYPTMLDNVLGFEIRRDSIAASYGDRIVGETDGGWRCALLYEPGREGLLLHREGDRLLCAYVPVLTEQVIQKERALALALNRLADDAGNLPILYERYLCPGKYQLRELLHELANSLAASE